MNQYNETFLKLLGVPCQPHKRGFVVWKLINKFFSQQTPYCYVCNSMLIRDNIKETLCSPRKWKYFVLKELYMYVDCQIEKTNVVLKDKDKNGLVDYYHLDAKD